MWLQSSMWSLMEVDKVPLKYLLVRGDSPWCPETLKLPDLKLQIWQERRGSGTTSLKLKQILRVLELLKTILTLGKGKRLFNYLASQDLTKADIFPI